MDNLSIYKKAAQEIIEEVAALFPVRKDFEVEVIADEKRGHFLLYDIGWQNDYWHYASIIHIDIKNDGKVWLQHDGTDLRIADWLVQKGIPKSDIVLGFHAPSQRPHIPEFAVA